MRADVRVFELGLTQSRERAHALILEGKVYADGKRIDKPGMSVKESAVIKLIEDTLPYVSRGGLKLKKAIDEFNIGLAGAVACDIGASTGGFTDCMLKEGAKEVYAIDVGYGQFDYNLRNDERVTLIERTNARYMQQAWFKSKLDFAAIDVSFISARLILAPLYDCLNDSAEVISLIKPQFEAGRDKVKKHGVIRDKAVHETVIEEFLLSASKMNYSVQALTFSPITGPKGNIEFLALLKKSHEAGILSEIKSEIKSTVAQAHAECVGSNKPEKRETET